ncbi:MAG: SMC-Scp complex subunit ScpB [Verrucomicrobiaceae bacterium]|nr:SMC-Scp complex subunit ScpB [Verrucomicrobiaceae bacterium]
MTLNKIVEALIFASQDPLTSKAIAKIVRRIAAREDAPEQLQGTKMKDVDAAILEINEEYERNGSPFVAEERSTGWKLYTRAEYGVYVRELYPGQKASRLSPPALETLAIIAYRQPITRAAIEAVRGVNVDGVMQTLVDRGLVSISGRADLPGRPLLYETSSAFLEHFGIKGVDELPNAIELRQVPLPQPEEQAEVTEEQLPLAETGSEVDAANAEGDGRESDKQPGADPETAVDESDVEESTVSQDEPEPSKP